MDENSPTPPAWLRFAVDGPEGIFLSDRHAWSERHREHMWWNRGTLVGEDDRTKRYLVGAFPLATTALFPCEICDEPNALIRGSGRANVLYTGDNLAEAERTFDEAIN